MTKDATWGNCNVISYNYIDTVGELILSKYNPFRYRGYYYDIETGFYYLQSRYYNAQWGRFLNADTYINANGGINGYNMFAYCDNTPNMYIDENGESIVGCFVVLFAAASMVSGFFVIYFADEYTVFWSQT